MTITVKPGDDIAWVGQITRTGTTDFTGYALTSQIRLKDPSTGLSSALLGTATIAWLDPLTGTFSYLVPRAVTATWPANACLLLDVRIEAPDTHWVRTETAEFETEAGVTA